MKDLPTSIDLDGLNQIAYKTLLNLSTNEGINASGKDDIFGCIFGRDSFFTILKILKAYQKISRDKKETFQPLMEISKKTLLTLISLQGKKVNIESGEEPGKFIHEFRKERFDHLIKSTKPWYLYPEGYLKNYDSIDSTPLGLIAIYKYWEQTQDESFLIQALPAVEAGLNWIKTYGDLDQDGLVEYEFHKDRTYGGLSVHSWTDSHESLTQIDGSFPNYPIAPVEAQAFAWLALKLWSDYYLSSSPKLANKLAKTARKIQNSFNNHFLIKDKNLTYAAQALDGDKNQIATITSNPLLVLWATYIKDGKVEALVNTEIIDQFIQRAFLDDLFVKGAGIRTMSSNSATFNPQKNSYHNGSFWPILNGLIIEGLENFGYKEHADKLKHSSLLPIYYFGSPLELYNIEGENLCEYISSSGQLGCKDQAWSAAAILEMTI